MPAPISDAATVARIHQNFAIAYLTECALPLSIDPGTAATLAELQAANSKDIVLSLIGDDRCGSAACLGIQRLAPRARVRARPPRWRARALEGCAWPPPTSPPMPRARSFIRALFDGLCEETAYSYSYGGSQAGASPTTSPPARAAPRGQEEHTAAGAPLRPTAGAAHDSPDSGGLSPASGMQLCTPDTILGGGAADSGAHGSNAAGGKGLGAVAGGAREGAVVSDAPDDEPHLLQLWGLLRELTNLAAALHPIVRVRVYKTMCAAGLFRALAAALAAPVLSSGWMLSVQVRAVDVLLALLNHDPTVLRNATIATLSDDAAAWGGPRADARRLIGGVVRMLGEGCDEGPLVQVMPPPPSPLSRPLRPSLRSPAARRPPPAAYGTLVSAAPLDALPPPARPRRTAHGSRAGSRGRRPSRGR